MTERRRLEPGELAEQGPAEAVRLPVDLVDANPLNPRNALAEIDALAENIKTFGLMQPVAVRRMGERYELISGHRRRAAFIALQALEPFEVQWRTIPAVVRTADDEQSRLMLISAQVHAKAWSAREEAGILEALAVEHTLIEIGRMVHKSEPWVSKRLKVYTDSVLSGYVQSGRLSVTVADELRPVRDPDQRRQYAERAVAEQWGPEKARNEVRKLRIDSMTREAGRLTRQLLEILTATDPSKLPISVGRDLWVLWGLIGRMGKGEEPVFPTIEAAQRAARINPNARPRKQQKKRRTMPPPA